MRPLRIPKAIQQQDVRLEEKENDLVWWQHRHFCRPEWQKVQEAAALRQPRILQQGQEGLQSRRILLERHGHDILLRDHVVQGR